VSAGSSLLHTCLHPCHLALGARMAPFAGWEMPIQYSGILQEARAVRNGKGVFDVSHMGRLRIEGPEAPAFLDRVLTTPVRTMQVGRARYGFLLTEAGGILDDTVLYRLGEERYLLVCNAANRPVVWEWLHRWAPSNGVAMEDATFATGMLAFQGPHTMETVDRLLGFPFSRQVRPFACWEGAVLGAPVLVGRTGYTGEDGVEFILPAETAPALWDRLLEEGAVPCGLGARDILRLEAGLLLHGSDMDTSTTPLEAGLERFLNLEKGDFIGRSALLRQQEEGLRRRLVGFVMEERGVPRRGYPILADGFQVGAVTSGGYSPTLERDIGLGYVAPPYAEPGTPLAVDIRGRQVSARVVPLPFYRRPR